MKTSPVRGLSSIRRGAALVQSQGRVCKPVLSLTGRSAAALLALAGISAFAGVGATAIASTNSVETASSCGATHSAGATIRVSKRRLGHPDDVVGCRTARRVIRIAARHRRAFGPVRAGGSSWYCAARQGNRLSCASGNRIGWQVSGRILARGAGTLMARAPVVLGKRHLFEPYGKGWGTQKPRTIYNGGVPSGLVSRIHWRQWGQSIARGRGLTAIYKPQGGYYPQRVRIVLRASNVGRCSSGGPLAYRQLMFRVPARPGGPLGRWHLWAGLRTICRRDYE